MHAVLAAFRFLTILPVPGGHATSDADWGRATAWYPLVGLVLGIILACLDWILVQIWPNTVSSALLLAAWVGLTGALHLDGFVDCCDALVPAASRDRRLEILRDVHVGAFGVVGAVLLLLLKYAALAAIAGAGRLPALLLVPTLGRWVMTGAVLLFPYARSGPGLGQKARIGAGPGQLAVATVMAILATGLAWWLGMGWVAVLLASWSVATGAGIGWLMSSRLGGLSGDTYGAICEGVEVINLLALGALVHGSALQ
jgi:cobalamin 5'-phosphate synthase/cobalamin synthase